jgi:hypothetical protein
MNSFVFSFMRAAALCRTCSKRSGVQKDFIRDKVYSRLKDAQDESEIDFSDDKLDEASTRSVYVFVEELAVMCINCKPRDGALISKRVKSDVTVPFLKTYECAVNGKTKPEIKLEELYPESQLIN